MSSSRPISAAILAGAGMLSIAVYLGLRDARPEPEAPAVARSTSPNQSSVTRPPFEHRDRALAASDIDADGRRSVDQSLGSPTAADEPKTSIASLPESSEVVRLAIARAEAMRTEIRSECWDGLPPGDDLPSSVPIVVNLSFGPDGTVLASGTAESRDARRDGVADCVGRKLHTMRIDPPGANVSVEIPIEVP